MGVFWQYLLKQIARDGGDACTLAVAVLNFRVASLTSECEAKGIFSTGRVCTLVVRVGD